MNLLAHFSPGDSARSKSSLATMASRRRASGVEAGLLLAADYINDGAIALPDRSQMTLCDVDGHGDRNFRLASTPEPCRMQRHKALPCVL